jgi:pyruvate dehydrogenase E1 component
MVQAANAPVTTGAQTFPIDVLRDIERKVLWLSTQIIHNANHERDNDDGLKVGGHQASSGLARHHHDGALFRDSCAAGPQCGEAARLAGVPRDPVSAGQPDARQAEGLSRLRRRAVVPSRTKDIDDVDFSTGSVGLGVAMTSFASLVQDYIRAHGWGRPGRKGAWSRWSAMRSWTKGNIYEALIEGWKHDLRNTWWVVTTTARASMRDLCAADRQAHHRVREHGLARGHGEIRQAAAVIAQAAGRTGDPRLDR